MLLNNIFTITAIIYQNIGISLQDKPQSNSLKSSFKVIKSSHIIMSIKTSDQTESGIHQRCGIITVFRLGFGKQMHTAYSFVKPIAWQDVSSFGGESGKGDIKSLKQQAQISQKYMSNF